MVKPIGIYIGLGSNLGDRKATLDSALVDLDADPDIRVIRCSSYHETEPVGGPEGQGSFLNAVTEIETTLSPTELLRRCQTIELDHGRERIVHHGPRTLDLDILLFGDVRMTSPTLTIPHPHMWERAFVLEPLAELCDLADLARLATH